MITHRMHFGSVEVGPVEGAWRLDVYIPDEPQRFLGGRVEDRVPERRMADGPKDTSAPHRMGDYDSRCSCCWLNIAHTEQLHTRRIREQKE